MKYFETYVLYVCLTDALALDDESDGNEIEKVMNKYDLHPIYQQVKEDFYKQYGDKEFTILERIDLLKSDLQNVYELTHKRNIPDDLKMIFRTTLNALRPDFGKLNHNNTVLSSVFNLTENSIETYTRTYKEASDMFKSLDKQFQVEADC